MKKNFDARSGRYSHDNRPREEVKYPFPVPEEYTVDYLGIMVDEDLSSLYTMLNQQRNDLLRQKYSTRLWDIELAYIQRESRIRQDRRLAHKVYTDALNEEYKQFQKYEQTLPEFVPNMTFYEFN